MAEKQMHHVQIASVELPLYSSDEADYVQDLARQLDTRIRTISKAGRGCTLFEAAVLCALDLLDEKVKGVDLVKTQQSQILSQLQELSELKGADGQTDLDALVDWEVTQADKASAPSPFAGGESGEQVSLFTQE